MVGVAVLGAAIKAFTELDYNLDGSIDSRGKVWSTLKIWLDKNRKSRKLFQQEFMHGIKRLAEQHKKSVILLKLRIFTQSLVRSIAP